MREPPKDSDLETQQEKALVALLRKGPRPLPEILEHLNLFSKIQIGTGSLVQKEIIARAGLTPTDLLHVEKR